MTIFRDGFPSSMLKQSTSLEPRAHQLGKSSCPACSKEHPAWLPRVGLGLQCHVGAGGPDSGPHDSVSSPLPGVLLDPHIKLYL